MGTFNRKVLARTLSVHQYDAEVERICSAVSSDKRASTPSDDLNHKDGANNIPDIVSSISESSQFQDSMEDHKDPDIVRSNSSSDEKSLEGQISGHRAACRPKTSDAGQSSVSSFSSSGSSKPGSSSSQDPGKKAVGSVGSLDNDPQQKKATVAREGSWTNCIYNQDSVFSQESEDMPDGTAYCRPWQQASLFRHISSPITEADSSLTSEEHDFNRIPRCSEKGQEARNRFSSSGYGTGSGDSSRGTSASKTSVHGSQESFSRVDTVLRKGVESSAVCSQELKHSEDILHSRAALSNSAILSSEVSLHVQNMTKSDVLKPAFQNPSYDNRATVNALVSSQRITAPGVKHFSCTAIGAPSVSETTEHRQPQQQAHNQHVFMNINPHQAQGQRSVVVQNVRQPPLNTIRQPPLNTTLHNIIQSHTGTVPPNVSHIQANAQPQNVGQSQASADSQGQSQIHTSSSVAQTPQADTNSMSTGLQQQPAPASNGKLSTVYDYHYHMRQLSLQHHPASSGSLNYTTANMSSSSRESCFVPSSVEDRWAADPSPVSWARLLLQSGSGVSESSVETRWHLESLPMRDQLIVKPDVAARTSMVMHPGGARHVPVFHQVLSNSSDSSVVGEMYSIESQTNDDLPDRNLWEQLQISVRCNETDCADPECTQIKAVMAVLQNERNDVHSLSSSHQNLLLAMFHHMAYVCDHPKCPFPWCGERVDNSHDLSRDECLLIMKQRMENFAEHCRLLQRPIRYMKLKTSFPYNCLPVEDQHWMRLCMMGNSRRTLLVKPLLVQISDPLSDTEYWVIKKVYLTDEGDNWSVYSRLREVKHRSVASLLWAASCEDHMLVCSMYEGFSLHDYLPSLPPSQRRFTPVFCIMQQLMSAIRHVNSLGIVYLNWTSKNILVSYHSGTDFLVKLSNFSCSVLLERPDGRRPCYDSGYLLLALPWHVVTPELQDDIKVEFVSDVWGIGCLLHELATGYPIWHEYRHSIDQDLVKSLVGKPPQVPDTCPELTEMFAACWQPDPSKRVPMSELEIMLIKAFCHHLWS